MKNRDSRVEEVQHLVEAIRGALLHLEANAGHSAEMALIRRALTDLDRLWLAVEAEAGRGTWNWEKFAPFLGRLAEIWLEFQWR